LPPTADSKRPLDGFGMHIGPARCSGANCEGWGVELIACAGRERHDLQSEARGLLCRRLEAYLFTATLKHLNRNNRIPPNEELG